MLTISLPAFEAFDNETNEFLQFPEAKLILEHSLRSISKWEGLRHEAFFQDRQMSTEEFLDYIHCMTTNPQKDDRVYLRLTDANLQEIIRYIEDPHSARKMAKPKRNQRRTAQTAEDFYSAMAYFGIPFECENWHFGRLAALIDKCSGQAGSGIGGKKMSFREQQMMFDEINTARLKRLGTRG